MSIQFKYLFIYLIAALLWSCDSGKDYDFFISKYSLRTGVNAVNIEGSFGAEASFEVIADCSWNAQVVTGAAWLEIVSGSEGVGNGTVTLKIKQATSSAADVATVTITCKSDTRIKQTVTVNRAASKSSITISQVPEFESAGGLGEFTISCNNDVQWRIQDNYSKLMIEDISPMEGTGPATIVLKVGVNTAKTSRSTVITVLNVAVNEGESLEIKQKEYSPSISFDDLTLDTAKGYYRMTFYTFGEQNVQRVWLRTTDPWNMSSTSTQWLHVDPTSGQAGSQELAIWVDEMPNDIYADSVRVKFSNSANMEMDLMIVRQTISINPKIIELPSSDAGTSAEFSIECDHPWRINTSEDDWVTFSQTTGTSGKTVVTVTAKTENASTSSTRAKTFSVNCTDIDKINSTFEVIQAKKPLLPSQGDNTPPDINN